MHSLGRATRAATAELWEERAAELGQLAQRGNEAKRMEQACAGKEEEKDGLQAREREEGIFHLPIFFHFVFKTNSNTNRVSMYFLLK